MIREYGLRWKAEAIDWSRRTRLLGTRKAATCDFAEQHGVYVLYGGDQPFYVGEAFKLTIAKRLQFHHKNKTKKYPEQPEMWWTHFSWFGFQEAVPSATGRQWKLQPLKNKLQSTSKDAISDLEALLIKTLPLHNTRPERFHAGREWNQIASIGAQND